MKKALQLRPVSAQIFTRDFGAFGTEIWFVHSLTDGSTTYKHWNKSENLKPGEGERVVIKIEKHGDGKPVSRMVNIVLA